MRCGVLALQGGFAAHGAVLTHLGAEVQWLRRPADLVGIDALVLPGGESTTMLRLIDDDGLGDALRDRIAAGLPTLATCAGVILLATDVTPPQHSFGLLDVDVARNAYGRQVRSTVAQVHPCTDDLGDRSLDAVFIRAPRIVRVGRDVRVLARRDGDPVLVEQGMILAATFHPELSRDDRIHRRLVRRAVAAACAEPVSLEAGRI